ncbi:MAG: hypothetical protein RL148_2657 [Planctomycetota bacterium]
MALAVAGPLARCLGADRETALRQQQGIELWRKDLATGLPAGAPELRWDEDPAVEPRRFDLGESGWMALRLLATYAERTDLELPDTVPALLELDKAWRKAADEKFARSRFGHLVAAECWLPAEFEFTVRAPLPDGTAADIGSLVLLQDQLKRLNEATFQAGACELGEWQALPAPAGGDLLDAARRGLAVLAAAAAWARAMNSVLLLQATATPV